MAGEHGLTERANTFDQRTVLQEFAQAATQARVSQRSATVRTASSIATTFCELGNAGRPQRISSAASGGSSNRRLDGLTLLDIDQPAPDCVRELSEPGWRPALLRQGSRARRRVPVFSASVRSEGDALRSRA